MHIDIEYPTDEDLVEIYADFNATKESVQRDVKYLIEWMEQQPHLPSIKDEEFLANFLIRSKNSLEATKSRLTSYYMCKATMPEVFANRSKSEKEIIECWNSLLLLPLPKMTPEKRRVVLHYISPDSSNCTVKAETILKLYTVVWDVGLKTDCGRGYILVYDFANLTIPFSSILVSTWKIGIQLLKKGAPLRLHKIYVLNLLPAFQPLVSFGLSILPKKIADRVIIWSKSSAELAEELPKRVLPSEYGGDEASIMELKDGLLDILEEYRDWFTSTENDKADLSKIPQESKSDEIDTIYGLNGSFRKISFD